MKDTTIMECVVAVVLMVVGAIVMVGGFSLLFAFPVKWTWNATMPYLFSLPVLTWGKAWCLTFLCGALIKSSSSSSSKSKD